MDRLEIGRSRRPRITRGWTDREEGPDCKCGPNGKAIAGVQTGDRERAGTDQSRGSEGTQTHSPE